VSNNPTLTDEPSMTNASRSLATAPLCALASGPYCRATPSPGTQRMNIQWQVMIDEAALEAMARAEMRPS
jgi:hypothetical protein